ncbi:hypothetical protein [Maritimibacter sp. 55A14]|uniref:hypothetical protein n=1 Tax=Maritimibacter sp. 55A14 TaxID=2174844 RepID=UPI0011B27605|nr:hypothetical protein [Maritimibacter sp. 55A14]
MIAMLPEISETSRALNDPARIADKLAFRVRMISGFWSGVHPVRDGRYRLKNMAFAMPETPAT